MLMNIKCSTEVSIKVHLKFDNCTEKEKVISTGDLIEVDFNQNGLLKHVEGKVLKICANGSDCKKWYLIVDGSGDFDSEQYRFSVMNILDVDIIRKADNIKYIETTTDGTAIQGLRMVRGRLQYTLDGFHWGFVRTDPRYIIKNEEGTGGCPPHPHGPGYTEYEDDQFGIRDEEV